MHYPTGPAERVVTNDLRCDNVPAVLTAIRQENEITGARGGTETEKCLRRLHVDRCKMVTGTGQLGAGRKADRSSRG